MNKIIIAGLVLLVILFILYNKREHYHPSSLADGQKCVNNNYCLNGLCDKGICRKPNVGEYCRHACNDSECKNNICRKSYELGHTCTTGYECANLKCANNVCAMPQIGESCDVSCNGYICYGNRCMNQPDYNRIISDNKKAAVAGKIIGGVIGGACAISIIFAIIDYFKSKSKYRRW